METDFSDRYCIFTISNYNFTPNITKAITIGVNSVNEIKRIFVKYYAIHHGSDGTLYPILMAC